MICENCPYAEWDYYEFYGTTKKQWIVIGCRKDKDPRECEDEEE